MSLYLGFILAASLGAALRWGISMGPHPWSTFLVNFIGSLAMGFLFIYLDKTSPQLKTWVCVAFLGAFTTFSSFSLDLVRLIDQGAMKTASFYFLSTNLLCISGCYMGWLIAKNLVTNS